MLLLGIWEVFLKKLYSDIFAYWKKSLFPRSKFSAFWEVIDKPGKKRNKWKGSVDRKGGQGELGMREDAGSALREQREEVTAWMAPLNSIIF